MPSKSINVKDRVMNDEIDLSMSELVDIPVKEIAQIKKATSLDVSNNNIKVLPKNFTILTHLMKLDLSRNHITELPENFGDLFRLRHLDLYQNNLQYLPLSFCKLKSLKWLDLKKNSLKPAIAEVAGPCLDTKDCQACARNIVKFYTTLQERVDTENEIREKQRKKQFEINLQKEKNEKKAKSKNKKQEANGKMKEITPPTIKKTNMKEKLQKKEFKEKKQTSFIPSIMRRFFKVFSLLFILLFILTSVDYKHTEIVKEQSIKFYAKGLECLPNNYKPYGELVGSYVSFVHEKTGNLTLSSINYIKESETAINLYNNIMTVAKDTVHKVSLFVKDFYKPQ